LIFLKKLILQRCRSTEAGSFFPVVAQYGGKYLVIGGPIDSVEATWRPAFPVLFELAHGWYNSEEYRDLKELRLGGNEGSRCFHGWRGDLRSVMTPSGGQLPHSD
jgi:hypothetical protein